MTAGTPQRVAIVGAGQAGFQVAASLRELGYAGAIRLFGDERYPPYQRPPLSKTYLKEDGGPERTYLRAERFFAEKGIDLVTGARVSAVDRGARRLLLADGRHDDWDNLVLTTGVTNRTLPGPGADLDGVVTLRGLDDAHALRPRLARARRILIIGGGVIGLEISALARAAGLEVVIVELADRLCGRIGSTALSEYFLHYHRGLGAQVHLATGVERLEGADGAVVAARLSSGEVVETSLVLVSIGVVPNVELARSAGLAVEDGIVVDAHMRTSDPAITAAGDCTRFAPPHGTLKSVRLESVQNAIDQGRCAAETIIGKPRAYDALPWFWSDQGSCKLQIAGLTQGHDHAIARPDPEKGTLSVFCFSDGRLVGVECINRPADFVAARRVLGARKLVTPDDLERAGFELKALMA